MYYSSISEAAVAIGISPQLMRYYIKRGRVRALNGNHPHVEDVWGLLGFCVLQPIKEVAKELGAADNTIRSAIARNGLNLQKRLGKSAICEHDLLDMQVIAESLVNVAEAATMIGVSKQMVRRYIKAGLLFTAPHPWSKKAHIERVDVEDFIANKTLKRGRKKSV